MVSGVSLVAVELQVQLYHLSWVRQCSIHVEKNELSSILLRHFQSIQESETCGKWKLLGDRKKFGNGSYTFTPFDEQDRGLV